MNKSLLGVSLSIVCWFAMHVGSPLRAGTLGGESHTPSEKLTMTKGHAHDRQYLKSVGPGEPPHTHAVAPDRFPQIAEIAMNPSMVPAPTSNRAPQKVRFHLEAKEGVALLADGTSYL